MPFFDFENVWLHSEMMDEVCVDSILKVAVQKYIFFFLWPFINEFKRKTSSLRKLILKSYYQDHSQYNLIQARPF